MSTAEPEVAADLTGDTVPPPREHSEAASSARRGMAAVAQATSRLYELVEEFDHAALREPSLLPGWSRAHVLSHLARQADAQVNLLTWARTGVEHPAYASRADRDADIAEGATRPVQLVRADLEAACQRLAVAAEQLPAAAWEAEVTNSVGQPVSAYSLPWARLRELWVHIVDLDRGVGFDDVPAEHVEVLIYDAVLYYAVKPGVPPVRLTVDLPGGRQAVWELGEPTENSAEVRGSANAMLGWLTGRETGSTLVGQPPTLPAWR
ncbi:maleylpyruvate isomerase family mycothiol-dependent enzyme [Solihabitans fulvus]|uniref:Maleylpyruvate isomerase family mycothiol-dependent enzyme n=1 Tax=Solihabitans fulvus TaxID=1892852 RepID=A0A5B2X0F7_9PSEU|nr:maleylpyruvate isomerase family mycothiol-dependent enzyme [Solihabitans fulvus]